MNEIRLYSIHKINNFQCSRNDTSKVAAAQTAPQTVTQAPAQTSWASLFANSSSSNTESQKKPVAKVSPYNSSQEPKSSNPPIRTAHQSTSNVPGKIEISSTLSDSIGKMVIVNCCVFFLP